MRRRFHSSNGRAAGPGTLDRASSQGNRQRPARKKVRGSQHLRTGNPATTMRPPCPTRPALPPPTPLTASSPASRRTGRRFPPPRTPSSRSARLGSHAAYAALHRQSLDEPEVFWREQTQSLVWRAPWTSFSSWTLPKATFFAGAKLNVSESCLDRHVTTPHRNKAAIVWEGEPGDTRTLTYLELHRQVVRMSAALLDLGVKAGDRVAIYMGMVPEAVVAMLACARVGAPHSVVFGGFSSDALRDRINDCGAKVLLTQDGAWRRGNVVPLKKMADVAIEQTPSIQKVVVLRRVGHEREPVVMKEGRDLWWEDVVDRPASPASLEKAKHPDAFDAEHPLFVLYTSGSTGKPKGVLHTSAGYLAGAHVTSKYVFDLRDEDVYWCTADIGWVTGHSYIVYGLLSNWRDVPRLRGGASTFRTGSRFWQHHRARHGAHHPVHGAHGDPGFHPRGRRVAAHDLSSLRLLGSVGEPINPEAWMWYHKMIGGEHCPIVDTWWQTETGSIMLTTLPGAAFTKPAARAAVLRRRHRGREGSRRAVPGPTRAASSNT